MAIWIMPKVLQRDLAHYKIVFKSRLGCSVEGDMIKYQVLGNTLLVVY